jgi:altronate dehydratase small subunit
LLGIVCVFLSRRLELTVKSKAVIINNKDNVATALTSMKAGSAVSIEVQGRKEKIRLVSDIPTGHKFALQAIPGNADIIKYGEPIGKTTAAIAKGEHVHVHNVVSHRARKEGI